MVGKQQVRVVIEVRPYGVGERVDELLSRLKMPHLEQSWLPIHARQLLVGLFEGRLRRGLCVVREHRQEQQFLNAP